MSLEQKTTTAIPNLQSTPVGDKEKSDKRNCMLYVGNQLLNMKLLCLFLVPDSTHLKRKAKEKQKERILALGHSPNVRIAAKKMKHLD